MKTPFKISWLITSLTALVSLVLYFRLPPQIPLFYSLALAEQQLAAKEWIFLFPVFSALVNGGHLLILKSIKNYEALIIKLFTGSTVLVQVVLLLAMGRILWIIL